MKLLKNIFKKRVSAGEELEKFVGTDCGCLTYDDRADVPIELHRSVYRQGDMYVVTLSIKNDCPRKMYEELSQLGAEVIDGITH